MPTDRTRLRGQPEHAVILDDSNYGWRNEPTLQPLNGRVHTAVAFDRVLGLEEIRELSQHPPSLSPDRVRMPLFEIASNPTISLAEVRNRRFSLIDRPPMPAAIVQLLAVLTRTKRVPEPPPEPLGPIRRRSRYEVLAA